MLQEFNTRIDRAIETAANEIDQKKFRAYKAEVGLRPRESVRLLTQYLKERPNDELARGSLIWVLAILDDNEQAVKILQYLRERGDTDEFSAATYMSSAYRHMDASAAADFGLEALKRWPDNSTLIYQTHRTLMWSGRVLEGRQLAERFQRLTPQNNQLVPIRQARIEGRTKDAEKLLAGIDPDDNYARSSRWHALKILGREQEATEVLRPYAESGVPYQLANWLTYHKFDPSPFPAIMEVLEREGITRPPAVDIPFKCAASDPA